MQRWSVSIRANWSQFPAFIMATSGHVLRPYAAVCCHSLALPSPRPATGIKREGRHIFRASACAVVDRVGRTERGLAKKEHNYESKVPLVVDVTFSYRPVRRTMC